VVAVSNVCACVLPSRSIIIIVIIIVIIIIKSLVKKDDDSQYNSDSSNNYLCSCYCLQKLLKLKNPAKKEPNSNLHAAASIYFYHVAVPPLFTKLNSALLQNGYGILMLLEYR